MSTGGEIRIDDFLWMRAFTVEDGTVVHAYEHVETRRHLYLDGDGCAYRFVSIGDRYALAPYRLISSVIAHVLNLDGFSLGDHLRHDARLNESENAHATDE